MTATESKQISMEESIERQIMEEFKQQELEQYFDQNVTLEPHPLLDINRRKTKDDDEDESNMVVIIPYRGVNYRIDFSREGEDLMKMPRHAKKMIALEDIKKTVEKEDKAKEDELKEAEKLKKDHPSLANQIKQDERKCGIVDRLRAKLLKKNPIKYGKIFTERGQTV